jgi:cytoplasmic iron level regulating protein YaaA (DUF328/UPF0246 family)
MLIVLSPAKTLDFESELVTESASQPLFLDKSEYLVNKLKKFSGKKLQTLFNVNPDIAEENRQRFSSWHRPFHLGNARQAVLAFKGEVYRGLNAANFNDPDFEFAEKHLFILSGLYGILRPLDLIQPYRLEMGTSWEITPKTKNLYGYWSESVTSVLNKTDHDGPLLNLASNEYFKVIDQKQLNREIITCHFKDLRNGEYKPLMTYAKHARGLMTRFVIRNKITDPELLKGFDKQGYLFNSKLSTEKDLVFTRDQAPTP